jgi:hypothetical protein
MRPIETHYAGHRFRSRLEARWAVFFDRLGLRWEYEPQGYLLDRRPYLPDFKLILPDDRMVFAEVKSTETDKLEGGHVERCRALATASGCWVVLLVGVPAYGMYNLVAPGLAPNSFMAAFFTDYGPMLNLADEYWFQQVELNQQTGALEFSHDERAAGNSFGQGFVEAVQAARSARFEHGETPKPR